MAHTINDLKVRAFVNCVAAVMDGPEEVRLDLEQAIEHARRMGQDTMDSSQLADGERLARLAAKSGR